MNTKAILIILIIISAVTAAVYFVANKKPAFKNVILISMDTTRADHLSCYGYPQETTPNIDAVAEHGFVFENAVSPVPLTLPSHSSIFTGTIPPYHGVHDNLNNYLNDSNITITEILKENNFTTFGIISAFVLDSRFGLDQGFDHYNDQFEQKPNQYNENERIGGEVTDNALSWIEEHKDEKFFMFLHYFDPHAEYTPPEPFATQFKYDPYAGEIAYTDHCIGKVLDRLKKLKLYDSTLLIIVGDHGEMLGSHGELSHSFYIYEGALRIPLIIKAPGQQKARRVKSMAGVIDIFPTICSLLGIDVPDNIQGVDLLASAKADSVSDPERYLYCESLTPTKYNANSLLGLIGEKYKYIQTTRPELYDLVNDPAESNNIIESRPNLARILQDKLKQTIKSAVSKGKVDSKMELDAESIRRLESLGYVGGEITEDFSFDRNQDDPKDLFYLYMRETNIGKLIQKKEFDQAKELCLEILDKQPDIEVIYSQLVNIAQEQKEPETAVKYMKKLVELSPDSLQYNIKLADAYIDASEYDLAFESLQKSLKLNPDQSYVHAKIGLVFIEKKDFQKALYHLNESLRLDPFQIVALNLQAKIYDIQKNSPMTIEYINRSLSVNSNQPKTLNTLAKVYYSQGKIYNAIETWQKVLEFTPDDTSANNNVAWTKATSKDKKLRDPLQAIILAERACMITEYRDPDTLDTLAAAYASAGDFTKAVETARKGIDSAKAKGDTGLASTMVKRLSLYQKNKPYRE